VSGQEAGRVCDEAGTCECVALGPPSSSGVLVPSDGVGVGVLEESGRTAPLKSRISVPFTRTRPPRGAVGGMVLPGLAALAAVTKSWWENLPDSGLARVLGGS
jgi:hypothetical protein